MKKSPQRRVGRLALVQLAVLIAAVSVQSLIDKHKQAEDDKRLKVYVVLPIALPLQAQSGNDVNEILDLSNRFRDEIARIFGDQAEVKPSTYRAATDLDEWKEMKAAVARTRATGFEADLVLVNQANVTQAEETFLSLLLRVKVHSPATGKDVYTDLPVILQRGRLKNLPHIALRSSLQILDGIRGTPLAPRDEQTVVKQIFDRYQDLLNLEAGETLPHEILEKMKLALQSSPLNYGQVQKIINEYPYDETERLRKAVEAKEQAWLYKAGLANLPSTVLSSSSMDEEKPVTDMPKGGAV